MDDMKAERAHVLPEKADFRLPRSDFRPHQAGKGLQACGVEECMEIHIQIALSSLTDCREAGKAASRKLSDKVGRS